MDRKSILILVACFALMMAWFPLVNKLYPPKPLPPQSTNAVAAPPAGATNQAATAVPSVPAFTATTNTARKPTAFLGEEQTLVVTNADARYVFTSRGGGLKLIELAQYPEVTSRRKKNQPLTNGVATLNTRHAAPVLALLSDDAWLGDGDFTLTPTTNGVRAEQTLESGLRLVKDFQIGTNYLVHAAVRLENTSSNALTLPVTHWVIGTATPMAPDDKGDADGVIWYDGSSTEEKLQPWFVNEGFLFFGGAPRPEYRAGSSNVVWASAHNQFFAMIAMPDKPAEQVISRMLDLPRPAEGWYSITKNPPPRGFQTALVYPATTLAPGQVLERQVNFYAGPKEYRTLARIAARFGNNVDLLMGFGGFFGFFSKALLLAMNWLVAVLHLSYGWAIVALTVILKVLFWPLTAASTRSAKRMQELAPQLKALQEKYKDEPQKFSAKQWEFWKKNKVNPMSGCLPMLVQLPVFFGLYGMIRTAIELRGAHWFWVADLSKPDTLFVIPGLGFIPFIGAPEGLPFNLLPLIYIASAVWQTHITPMSPGMDPMQQKIIRWMPLMFLAILYNFSSGLALYMTVNNLLTILQMRLTKSTTPPATPPATNPALTPAAKKKK